MKKRLVAFILVLTMVWSSAAPMGGGTVKAYADTPVQEPAENPAGETGEGENAPDASEAGEAGNAESEAGAGGAEDAGAGAAEGGEPEAEEPDAADENTPPENLAPEEAGIPGDGDGSGIPGSDAVPAAGQAPE